MPISQAELHTIITDPEGAETLVRVADLVGRQLKEDGLNTTQIRALFTEVRQIQAQWSMGSDNRKLAGRRLVLLKPKMAYRARRSGKAVGELVEVLDPALDQVIKQRDEQAQDAYFRHFVEFFEAILAYHKAYGGS